MASIGIFYGSTTGNTQAVAETIGKAFRSQTVALKSISDISYRELTEFDLLILGSSTWGYGDLQDDWETALPGFDKIDLTGKKIALFGLGDQDRFPDTFLDALGIIAEKIRERGGDLIGNVGIDGFSFNSSKAVDKGHFVGLPLDDDNQGELTSERIAAWVGQLEPFLA